jgi:hypothetical protein
MATLPRVREIEELCKKAQLDPRVTQILCLIAERQRVQHQQIMGIAQLFNGMQDMLKNIIEMMGIRDQNLRRLGVEEMLKDAKGVTVESVSEFDSDAIPTNTLDEGRKN